MEQTSTHNLLVLHAYGETSLEQRAALAKQLGSNENLQQELMEIISTGRQLTSKLKSPSATSLRIIMDYSHKTEHLHEI